MDHRTESFARRFRCARPHLGAGNIEGLISLKYRDEPVGSSEYSHFIDDYLKRSLGLDVAQLDGDFGGQAWLVTDKAQNKAILVEHETGLEMLGAIGSVASLIALLPLISSGWASLRHRFSRHPLDRPSGEGVEIRRFEKDVLVEQRAPSIEVYVLNTTLQDYALLKQKVDQMETEVENLKRQRPTNDKKRPARSKRKGSKKR